MSIFREFNISMIPGKPPLIIHVSQYESDFVYTFHLVSGKSVLAIPETAIAVIRGTKRDGNGYSKEASLDTENNKVVVIGEVQLTACAGRNVFELAILNNEKTICTANFFLDVERAPLDSDTIQSETVLHDLQAIINSAATATQAAEEASASAAEAAESARTLTIDPTLTQSGQAADAKVVGDKINSLKSGLNDWARVLDRIISYGLYPFNGGLTTINTSLDVDTRFVYYNSNSQSPTYKMIMWYDGTSWKNILGGVTTDDIAEYINYMPVENLEIVISRMLLFGIESYSGGIATLNAEHHDNVDIRKVYYLTAGTPTNQIAWYNGTKWETFEIKTKSDFANVNYGFMYGEVVEIIKKFLKSGINKYSAGIATIRTDVAVDTEKIYYNGNTDSVDFGKIMFHNGENWYYSKAFASYTELTNVILSKIVENIPNARIVVATCNCGTFNYGDGTTTDSEYLLHWRSMLNSAEYDVFGMQEWSNTGQKYSQSELFGDTITKSFPLASNPNMRLFVRGTWEKVKTITYNNRTVGYSIKRIINGVEVYVYCVYCQWGDTEEYMAARQAEYQTLITDAINYQRVVIMGDFNAHTPSEYDIFATSGYSLGNCGYNGEFNTLRDLPADNIIFKGMKLVNFALIDSLSLNTDHKPIKATLLI